MDIQRFEGNPVISPDMVKPSQEDYRVEGTFNAGVIEHDGEIIVLLRVAECIINNNPEEIHVPILELDNKTNTRSINTQVFNLSDPLYDFSDPREIKLKENPQKVFLTSMSHIRVARSMNGKDFEVAEKPFIFPENRYEAYGCEDPRITQIGNEYYINYSSVSSLGISTSLARTSDFNDAEKLGIIFSPDNRDVCFFPEKINGHYWALHRPAPLHFGTPEIWIAKSPDLIHWGDHQHLLACSSDAWDQMKIGGGAPMIKTNKGWLQIYHGVDQSQRYCLGAFLVDLQDPTHVIARLQRPLIEPKAQHEVEGFFGNVVFSCGAIIKGETLHIYYGAADQYLSLATVTLDELWQHLAV